MYGVVSCYSRMPWNGGLYRYHQTRFRNSHCKFFLPCKTGFISVLFMKHSMATERFNHQHGIARRTFPIILFIIMNWPRRGIYAGPSYNICIFFNNINIVFSHQKLFSVSNKSVSASRYGSPDPKRKRRGSVQRFFVK